MMLIHSAARVLSSSTPNGAEFEDRVKKAVVKVGLAPEAVAQ